MPPAKEPQKAKATENMKQKSLMSFFNKPADKKAAPAPAPAKAVKTGPAVKKESVSTQALKTPDPKANMIPREPPSSTASARSSDMDSSVRASSPLPTSDTIDVDMFSDDDMPMKSTAKRIKRKLVLGSDEETEGYTGDKGSATLSSPDFSGGSSPLQGRVKKRRVSAALFLDDEDEDGEDSEHVKSFSSRLSRFKKSPVKSGKKSKARSDDDDGDFIVPGSGSEDERPSSRASDRSSSSRHTTDDDDDDTEPETKSKSKSKAKAAPKRPPLTKSSAGGSSTGLNANSFLTAAERREQSKKEEKTSTEEPFSFLVDVRDKDGIKPGEPGYDPRTLYVPKSAWKQFTPFEKQFWEIKQNHFDTVLFFQKGKFLEARSYQESLYEDDARIGHREFDLKLTHRVKMSMVGVPEMSFNFWAAKFLGKGYKVGRVDQAETALGAEMRLAKSKGEDGGKDKIVRRSLNKVFTNGTLVDDDLLTDEQAGHCISLRELPPVSTSAKPSFGACVLDSATSQFNLSFFEDDVCLTRLETLVRQLRPKEVVFTKGNLSVATTRLLKAILPAACLWTSLRDVEGYDYDQTLTELNTMFGPGSSANEDETMDADDGDSALSSAIPQEIRDMASCRSAIEALGAMAWYVDAPYLKQLNIDRDLLTMRNFNVYDPMKRGQNLVLDGQTLAHVEVLMNTEGNDDGSLHKMLNRCITPFGKRLFRIWLCVPLRDVKDINSRLDAVSDLMEHPTFEQAFSELVKGMPDLERIVSRIHAKNCKVKDFIKVLTSFKKLSKGFAKLADTSEEFESKTILGLLRSAPDLEPHIDNVESRYTVDKDADMLLPVEGKDDVYDEVMCEIGELEKELEGELKKFQKKLGIPLTWWHSAIGNKEIYLVQTKPGDDVPDNWVKNGGTKNAVRYVVPSLQATIRRLKEARENRGTAVKEFKNRLFAEFDADRGVWLRAVRVLAELDCLFSLSKSSSALGEPMCRPEFVEGDAASMEFEELRHPTLSLLKDTFIPNDVKLGGEVGRIALLTGPNMGGKSTVMRMTATGVIMAQLGMFVPAKSARICPVDAILTRMGAYDSMFSNASTFKVELDECCKILRDATPRSLVILDELGRGTSTYDGMAIAGAVLHQLATHTLPLTFFATHYGSLTDDFAYHPNIRNMHMSTLVDDEKRELVFLYKLVDGVATGSFGTHVANLAGVPSSVVERADVVSKDFAKQFKAKLEDRQKKSLSSKIPLVAQADFAYLLSLATGKLSLPDDPYKQAHLLKGVKEALGRALQK
ncbi:DNA mismatch repair protein Msh6 [Coniophora puteana RWD-64-598 SS2]|uniref:DNA mismatch repair protein n=1 Tax=Coniophora puteana (strain RWD-64-598) TaxID=741705 RepID=A0A5M3MHE4_CONPW|nr:DNA mismatch repair protein Msh6 [Coniophora puteana RWD-64-598 SS2]EIW78648.1 DNA mismatch repair protein Msh6 [Coniophora puteana RWD-64-598 SS2]